MNSFHTNSPAEQVKTQIDRLGDRIESVNTRLDDNVKAMNTRLDDSVKATDDRIRDLKWSVGIIIAAISVTAGGVIGSVITAIIMQ